MVTERYNGLNQIRIMPWNGEGDYYLPFESETFTAYTTTNLDFDTEILRYAFQSLATPSSVIDFNMRTKTKTVLKEQEVVGGTFDKNNYTEDKDYRELYKEQYIKEKYEEKLMEHANSNSDEVFDAKQVKENLASEFEKAYSDKNLDYLDLS